MNLERNYFNYNNDLIKKFIIIIKLDIKCEQLFQNPTFCNQFELVMTARTLEKQYLVIDVGHLEFVCFSCLVVKISVGSSANINIYVPR